MRINLGAEQSVEAIKNTTEASEKVKQLAVYLKNLAHRFKC